MRSGPYPRWGQSLRLKTDSILPLFSTTLFVSAFLMFLVEPMVAKMALPILGGAPIVWNTCVVFFQITLLAGYAYTHAVTAWMGERRHAFLHAALVLLPIVTVLPVVMPIAAPPNSGNPVGWLLLALARSVGLPFFVLSTTTSIIPRWFSRTGHRSAHDPYFLFVASNLGSLLGLVAYPALVEPLLPLHEQTRVWAVGYGVFAVLAPFCFVAASRQSGPAQPASLNADRDVTVVTPAERVSWARRARWVALAFIPSSLMLAVTTHISTDIAAAPLLWVVPLSLYLITFALAFGARGPRLRAAAAGELPLLIIAIVVFMALRTVLAVWLLIPLHLAVFTAAALMCHGALAADRPSPAHLTEFFFWVAFGGMTGGLFNTLAAPRLFTGIAEYPIVLVLTCLFRSPVRSSQASTRRTALGDVALPLVVGVTTAALIAIVGRFGGRPDLAFYVPAFLCLSQSKRQIRFALCIGALLLASWLAPYANRDMRPLYAERTFFGVYGVGEDPTGRYRVLYHGTTLHGMQTIDPGGWKEPLAYVHRAGPFGEAFTALSQRSTLHDVAIVGLGVGSLATYSTDAQRWTFFEIDPAVERIARSRYFTFLDACGDRCRVVTGDARLSLARNKPGEFSLFVLDAFNSDTIPVHLLTSEALSLYLSHLEPGGVLAFHISNRYLSLGPVLARLADHHGLAALERFDDIGTGLSATGKLSSHWLVMARETTDFGSLTGDSRWRLPRVSPSTPLWTDDFSNILSVLRLR